MTVAINDAPDSRKKIDALDIKPGDTV